MKKTLIIGASPNAERYAYKAAVKLVQHGHPIVNIGRKKGTVAGVNIVEKAAPYADIDTITLYINAKNQREYYDYILQTHPQRLIFNPGAENPELEEMAAQNGIEVLEACTLVLLSIGRY